MGTIIYIDGQSAKVSATDKYTWVDRIVFLLFFGIYVLMHIWMIIWLFRGPRAVRKQMQNHAAINVGRS